MLKLTWEDSRFNSSTARILSGIVRLEVIWESAGYYWKITGLGSLTGKVHFGDMDQAKKSAEKFARKLLVESEQYLEA